MSYVESFDTEMELARLDCNALFLDRLQAAHDAEMKQLSKEEFHRGYESGVAARDAEQWQLDRERAKIIEAVRKVVPEGYFGSDEMLSEICRAIYSPVFGWTAEAGRDLCNRFIYLLGGENVKLPAELDAEFSKNGENHQTGGYDALGNERHKVVCRLRGFEPRNGGKPSEEASKLIQRIIGREDCHVACVNDLEEARDRLIYLLGGKSINKGAETSAKVIQNGEKYQLATYDVLGNERHKAVCELRKLRDRGSVWGRELVVALGLSVEATNDDFCDRLIYLLGGDDGTASNDDRTCPIAVQSPSITDELRTWATERTCKGISYTDASNLALIADRIDAQFSRICSQHESVLQQTISETVNEHEREMAELRSELEEAQALIADNANDWTAYRIAQRERDDLHDKYDELRQKISARDAIISNYHERMKDLDESEHRRAVAESKCKELRKRLDDYDKTHVELPKDVYGDYWHIGDESEYGEVTGILYNNTRTLIEVRMGNGERATFGASLGRKANPATVEQAIRDLTLGKITESQAIERIEGING